jgi:hypothetical protein
LRRWQNTTIEISIIKFTLFKRRLTKVTVNKPNADKSAISELGMEKIPSFNDRRRKVAAIVFDLFTSHIS